MRMCSKLLKLISNFLCAFCITSRWKHGSRINGWNISVAKRRASGQIKGCIYRRWVNFPIITSHGSSKLGGEVYRVQPANSNNAQDHYYQANCIPPNGLTMASLKLVSPPAWCFWTRWAGEYHQTGHLCYYWPIGRTMGMKKALLFCLEEGLGEKRGTHPWEWAVGVVLHCWTTFFVS